MTVLALRSVSKRYGAVVALDALSLELCAGGVTALLGRSGCGKSTLLKLCNGLEQPDGGVVELFGQALDYAELSALRRRIGYAVQGSGLFPHLTVGENITLVARLSGWSRQRCEERVAALMQLTHLEQDLLARYPHQVSGGQQQRAGLCRAMMLRPELLLLDEPFAAIDPLTRLDIQRQFLEIHSAEPTTTLLVTHDMAEAMRLADRIVVMDAGRLVHSGNRRELQAAHPGAAPDEILQALLPEGAS